MLVPLVFTIAFAGQRAPLRSPRWFDHSLAGYELAYDQAYPPAAVYDPSSGFMLIREPECDGGDLTLLLTRDRHEVQSFGFNVPNFKSQDPPGEMPMKVQRLPRLSTGRGVKVGDSPARVEKILGKGHKRQITGVRKQFLNFKYSWTAGSGESGRLYEQTYTFKEGKLIEILFSWGPSDERDVQANVQHAAKKESSRPDRD